MRHKMTAKSYLAVAAGNKSTGSDATSTSIAFPGLDFILSLSDNIGGGSMIETFKGLPSAMMPLNFCTICWATSRFSTVSSAETLVVLVEGANAAAMMSTCCLKANYRAISARSSYRLPENIPRHPQLLYPAQDPRSTPSSAGFQHP